MLRINGLNLDALPNKALLFIWAKHTIHMCGVNYVIVARALQEEVDRKLRLMFGDE